MPKFILLVFILGILVTLIQCDDIPGCDFFDTVTLTDRFSNGSYKYKDLSVPVHLTGEYDYVINSDGGRDPVPKHIRGCVCKIRTCIRFCCHPQKRMNSEYTGCSSHMDEALTFDFLLNVTQNDGKTVVEKHILDEVIVQDELPLPCDDLYRLDAEQNEDDHWSLLRNGSLFRHLDAQNLSKQEYCLQPNMSSTGNNYTVLMAFSCYTYPPVTTAYIKLCSIFFMSLTILAYWLWPKFHSLHGRICNLYFICLTLTFLLNVLSMFRKFEKGPLAHFCKINGYAGYFLVMATFMWLSVISFDVWRRLSVRQFKDFYDNSRSNFLKYNIIVWITASILTIIVMLLDAFVEFDDDNPNTPGVGKYACWINTNNWSAMVYFYLPLSILIVVNGVLFCLTTRFIYMENKGIQKELNRIAQQRRTRNRANYRIYLRLFIIMGGSWFLEIIGYICEMEHVLKPIIMINDIVNCSQGIIIFLATFCNCDMLKTISKRLHNRESITTELTSGSRRQETKKPARN